MGYLSSPDRILAPSRSRLVFLLLGIAAYVATELGRFVYRPYARQSHLADFGLADSVGNLGGIGVQIFPGLAVLNSTRRQSYRMAAFFAVGYVVYEFAQPYLPKGVFDWKDIIATAVGYAVSVAVIAVVWRTVEPSGDRRGRGGAEGGAVR